MRVPLLGRSGDVRAYALLDDADAPLVAGLTWRLHKRTYRDKEWLGAQAKVNGQTVLMHRVIASPPAGSEVDHMNGDGLDNRRSNLRVVTHAENLQNKASYSGASSRFRGVYFHIGKKRWCAQVRLAGKNYHMGTFASEEDARNAAIAGRARLMTHSVEERLAS